MFKKFCIAVSIVILGSNAFAKELKVSVNGMVCSFCAQGIHKKLINQDAVKEVDVNLSTHLVKVSLKDGKDLSDESVTQILKDAGFTVSKIERD